MAKKLIRKGAASCCPHCGATVTKLLFTSLEENYGHVSLDLAEWNERGGSVLKIMYGCPKCDSPISLGEPGGGAGAGKNRGWGRGLVFPLLPGRPTGAKGDSNKQLAA